MERLETHLVPFFHLYPQSPLTQSLSLFHLCPLLPEEERERRIVLMEALRRKVGELPLASTFRGKCLHVLQKRVSREEGRVFLESFEVYFSFLIEKRTQIDLQTLFFMKEKDDVYLESISYIITNHVYFRLSLLLAQPDLFLPLLEMTCLGFLVSQWTQGPAFWLIGNMEERLLQPLLPLLTLEMEAYVQVTSHDCTETRSLGRCLHLTPFPSCPVPFQAVCVNRLGVWCEREAYAALCIPVDWPLCERLLLKLLSVY